MRYVKALLTAGTLIAFTASLIAQQMQAPPPRVIGAVQVDQVSPAPVQVIRGVTLAATPAEVFDHVSDHRNWPGFHGALESVAVSGDGRDGSTWSYAMVGGGAFSARITAFDRPGADGLGTFAYAIQPGNPFGVQHHLAILELRPADGGGTALMYYQIFDHPDVEMMSKAVVQGNDEILSRILYRFGGEPRAASHGSSSMVIEQRRIVEASEQRAWRVLGEQWGEVDEWASAISHSTVSQQRGSSLAGATRSCEVPGSPGFRETMLTYDADARSLSYQVIEGVPPFITHATNTWHIYPLSEDRSIVTSRIELAVAPGTPQPAVGMVKGQFTQLMDLSVDELVHYIETGRPHPRKVAAKRATSRG
ncbi:MAG: SRPBCC family protein [Acidobacteriota bacterium]